MVGGGVNGLRSLNITVGDPVWWSTSWKDTEWMWKITSNPHWMVQLTSISILYSRDGLPTVDFYGWSMPSYSRILNYSHCYWLLWIMMVKLTTLEFQTIAIVIRYSEYVNVKFMVLIFCLHVNFNISKYF